MDLSYAGLLNWIVYLLLMTVILFHYLNWKFQFETLRQGSEHCLVCAPVGASWCDIFRFWLVLARCGAGFWRFYGSGAWIHDGSLRKDPSLRFMSPKSHSSSIWNSNWRFHIAFCAFYSNYLCCIDPMWATVLGIGSGIICSIDNEPQYIVFESRIFKR